MRDDSLKWTAPGSFDLTSDTMSVSEISLPSQVYVSGTQVMHRFAQHLVTWPNPATADRYALSLRRDRVLCVGTFDLSPGYHPDEAMAVTDVSDGFVVLALSGSGAFEQLRRGAELRIDQPSRSVMRQMFGVEVMLYRWRGEHDFRMHVPRAFAQTVFEQLTGRH